MFFSTYLYKLCIVITNKNTLANVFSLLISSSLVIYATTNVQINDNANLAAGQWQKSTT